MVNEPELILYLLKVIIIGLLSKQIPIYYLDAFGGWALLNFFHLDNSVAWVTLRILNVTQAKGG